METFFENTNDDYIDFVELTDVIESPSASKFHQNNLEKEDNMECEATSNASSKQQQSSVTRVHSEETKIPELNSDSSFSLKENLSIENR